LMLLLNILIMSVGMALRVRQIQIDKVAADNKANLALQRTQEERRFVAMLSHEFRNPLATIDRTAQMLILTNADLADAAIKRFHAIRASVSRLSSLVDNFLMSERIEEDRLVLHRANHAITALADDIKSHFTEEDWSRVHVNITSGKAVFDKTMLSMAVSNLLHNALRYANQDSDIHLTLNKTKQQLMIIVADSGPGISEEEMRMLGTPYYRAANSFGKKGTGLGYFFCKRIVELHGGKLLASKSKLGGLQVTIQLKCTSTN
jgi:two-component system, sensor histidine kinase LadS